MNKQNIDYFKLLQNQVISKNLCTHCGLCPGLYPNEIGVKDTINGPIPYKKSNKKITDDLIYNTCPGRNIKYQQLHQWVFNKPMKNFLIGYVNHSYIGFSNNIQIRKNAASGGIITSTLIYLLKTKLVDGCVVIKQGYPKPYLNTPIIATTEDEILKASQSVYVPVMTNQILAQLKNFKGKVAYVGLPDQVAVIRTLQQQNHKIANKIEYIIGPYTGTAMYFSSIQNFLKSHHTNDLKQISYLRYRDGEWPGALRIDLKNGKSFRLEKFYYNYLIPFFITNSSIHSIDFTNELTDISVGDAWNPTYINKGQGFSVILARTEKGQKILDDMKKKNLITLTNISKHKLINMHAHMIDFKKRGAFIRLSFRKLFKLPVPEYDYHPTNLPISRYLIEFIIYTTFIIGKNPIIRNLITHIPQSLLGKVFNMLRISWKKISKSTKRSGLIETRFQ